jgi:hypothetical protein
MTRARLNLRPALFRAALCTAVLLATALALPAAADTLLTLESRQALSVQGQEQPERSQTVQIWIGENAIARDDAETRMVLIGDELLLISHRNRNFNRLPLPIDPISLAPPEMREQARTRFEESKLHGEITAVDETQEVGDWTAKRYDLALSSDAGLSVDMVFWASPEVDVSVDRFNALTRALASMQLGGAEWVSTLDEIEGFPVKRETTMMNEAVEMHSTEELVSVEEAEAPADMYGPPAGYTEVEIPAAADEEDDAAMEEDEDEMETEMEEMEEDGGGEQEMEEDGEG